MAIDERSDETTAARRRSWPTDRLNASQVNLMLEVLIIGAISTGLASWAVGTGWGRWLTIAHALCGLSILVLAPAKMRRSVKTGMRRRRATRWLSVAFGILVLVTVAAGLAHSTGVWFGIGYWSALWIHFLAAFVLIPVFVWHLVSRPVRPRRTDADRRLLLGGAAAVSAAAAIYGVQEVTTRVLGLAGGDRRFTGSHEIASFDPDRMPTVVWIDDTAPDTPVEDWVLRIAGEVADLDELRSRSRPLDAILDCTGGWWSEQRWDVVPLAAVGDWSGRSIKVDSATGYARWFPTSDADRVYLALGYDGRPLRRGHGAPVRIVAPGRRGPWWIKWVTEVESSDRPPWLQLPFPPT